MLDLNSQSGVQKAPTSKTFPGIVYFGSFTSKQPYDSFNVSFALTNTISSLPFWVCIIYTPIICVQANTTIEAAKSPFHTAYLDVRTHLGPETFMEIGPIDGSYKIEHYRLLCSAAARME